MPQLRLEDVEQSLRAPLQLAGELASQLKGVVRELQAVVNIARNAGKEVATGNVNTTKQKKAIDDLTRAQARFDKANSSTAKQLAIINERTRERNKQLKEEARNVIGATSAYDKLDKELKDAIRLYRHLAAGGKAANVTLKQQENIVNTLQGRIKAIDFAVGQFNRNVGNYPRAINSANNSTRSFTKTINNFTNRVEASYKSLITLVGAFGIIAGIQIFTQLFREFIQVSANFERSLDTLSSITGATGDALEFFREQAIATGLATKTAAGDVVEAYKQIGSARPELLKDKEALAAVTEEAIILSQAAEIEVPEAAKALASGLNQFRLPASNASRVINALAAGSKEGSEFIPVLGEALEQFGGVARAANVSVEQSIALVETLGPAGLRGSRGGIQLRNVLLRLQAGAKETNPAIVGLDQALENLANQNLSVTELTKRFGVENVLAAQTLVEQRKEVTRLTKAVTGTSVAYEQANTNLDNFQGDVKEFKSTFEALIVTFTSGDSAFNKLARSIVQAGTKVLRVYIELKDTLAPLTNQLRILFTTLGDIVKSFQGVFDSTEKAGIAVSDFFAVVRISLAPLRIVIQFFSLWASAVKSLVALLPEGSNILTEFATIVGQVLKTIANAPAILNGFAFAVRQAFLNVVGIVSNQLKTVEELIKAAFDPTKTITEVLEEARDRNVNSFKNFGRSIGFAYSQGFAQAIAENKDELLIGPQQQDKNGLLSLGKELFGGTTTNTTTTTTEEDKSAINRAKARARQLRDLEFKRLEDQLKESVRVNSLIAKDESNSYEDRERALVETSAARRDLLEAERTRLLEIAKRSAEDRIDEEGKKVTEKLIEQDKILASEREVINQEINNKLLAEQDNFISQSRTVYFDQLEKEYAKLSDSAKLSADQQIKELNRQLVAGEISIKQYQEKRQRIEADSNLKVLQEQKRLLLEQLNNLRTNGVEVEDIKRELAQVEIDIEQAKVDKILQMENEVTRKRLENQKIIDASFRLGSEVFNGVIDNRKAKLDEELAASERIRQIQLDAVGDDEQAKLAINKKFDREQAKIKEKQARADKQGALFNIAIQTAQNIAKAFPNPVLIALAAALGLAQAAIVNARPIPKYFKGTFNSARNFIAGDRGREIVVPKNVAPFITPDRATYYTNMAGATVIPNNRTEEILGSIRDADLSRSLITPLPSRGKPDKDERMLNELVGIRKGLSSVNNKVDVLAIGSVLYEVKQRDEEFKKYIRSLTMYKWN